MRARDRTEAMKDSLLHHAPIAQMFDHDALEELRRDAGVPDAFGIDHHDRAAGADAETGRLSAFDPRWSEQQIFALEQPREEAVERASSAIWRAEPARADQHVSAVRVHARVCVRHAR